MEILNASAPDFADRFDRVVNARRESADDVSRDVAEIIAKVRAHGDRALSDLTIRLDGHTLSSEEDWRIPSWKCEQAYQDLDAGLRDALTLAADRIRAYHEAQKPNPRDYTDDVGMRLGHRWTPVDAAGIYVPGGRAAYPSSLLMNAIPARVAGVERLVAVTPTPKGEANPLVLAAAHIAGLDEIWRVGGAQAIAALAYGTDRIAPVDVVTGPGNAWVAEAKRQVFGTVGIDMIAGPSEILVVCDGKTDPDWIAMDLFSQAEHDEEAQAILVSPDGEFLQQVAESMEKLAVTLERETIIRTSMKHRGAMIQVRDLEQAIALANTIASEHLELSIDDAEQWAKQIRHAGAIFLGRHTPEALGDYCAGPNHVLPTSATARFSSPLGVYDFQKRSSLIGCSPEGASELGKIASPLARGESLTAHARSAEYRIKKASDV